MDIRRLRRWPALLSLPLLRLGVELMSDQQRIETAAGNCEVLRARLARYEDGEGRPLQSGGVDERAAFEAWYLKMRGFIIPDFHGVELCRDEENNYLYRDPADSWRAWQARAALTASAPNHGEQVRDEWASGFKLHEIHKALDSGLPIPNYWAETCDGEPYVHTKLWRELPGCGSFHSSRFWPLYGVSMLAAAPSAGSHKERAHD